MTTNTAAPAPASAETAPRLRTAQALTSLPRLRRPLAAALLSAAVAALVLFAPSAVAVAATAVLSALAVAR
ncbi:hypothetical protein GGQ55_002872 [Geodermatophilus daqingensis]|uniref:Uncharacterized protein n=1 Tax=Petropleomorpha daqingensis TaxID=2026353 RepID=A0A853CFC3_9ACTN|nr:hypothetical protein [Petropleomorpha daqingensis]